jgi:hypothetical protein
VAVVGLLTTGRGGLTVSVRMAVPGPVALLAVKVTGKMPVTVGVPEMAPFVVLMVRPVGRPDWA